MEICHLKRKLEEGVLTIAIDRPAQLNALNKDVLAELEQVIDEAEKDASVRAIILTGEGKAFVAGADISTMVGMDETQALNFASFGQKVFDKIENLSKIVIAAINGFALGGGCELAMACDIRYASEKAKLGQPEVNLGVIPGFAGTQRLPRLVGPGKALELLVTGNVIDANQALQIGLVDKVLPPEGLMEEATNLAKTIATKCPGAVSLNKKALKSGLPNFNEKEEASLFAECFKSGNAKKGMEAFLNKTQADWS